MIKKISHELNCQSRGAGGSVLSYDHNWKGAIVFFMGKNTKLIRTVQKLATGAGPDRSGHLIFLAAVKLGFKSVCLVSDRSDKACRVDRQLGEVPNWEK